MLLREKKIDDVVSSLFEIQDDQLFVSSKDRFYICPVRYDSSLKMKKTDCRSNCPCGTLVFLKGNLNI